MHRYQPDVSYKTVKLCVKNFKEKNQNLLSIQASFHSIAYAFAYFFQIIAAPQLLATTPGPHIQKLMFKFDELE